MGLISGEAKTAILTDILGDEDHLGDMDFKVAGTRDGVTAIQMDIKIKGLTTEIMRNALEKARNARMTILDKMYDAISTPRPELSQYAPRIITIHIPVDEIGTVIGPGGKTVREIVEKTGAKVDILEDGQVNIASVDQESGEEAKKRILKLVEAPEPGKNYRGVIKKVTDFGAFVEILPGKDGLLHISEMDRNRIDKVTDLFNVGDEIEVKLLSIDSDGRMDLSRRAVLIEQDDLANGRQPQTYTRVRPPRTGGRNPRGGRDHRDNRGGRDKRGGGGHRRG